jgi:hypothetical protein
MGRKKSTTKKKGPIDSKTQQQTTSPPGQEKEADASEYGGMNLQNFKKNLGCGG